MEDKTCMTAFWKPSEKRWCACVRRGKAQYSLDKLSLCPLVFNAAPLTSTMISPSSPHNLCFMVSRQEISSFLPGWEIGYQRGSQRTEGSRWSQVVFNWTTKQSSFIQHFIETGCLQSLGFWGIVDLTHWAFLCWVSQLLHLLCDSKLSLPCPNSLSFMISIIWKALSSNFSENLKSQVENYLVNSPPLSRSLTTNATITNPTFAKTSGDWDPWDDNNVLQRGRRALTVSSPRGCHRNEDYKHF